MRLIGKIMNRMTVVLMATLLAWCLLFYYAIQREMIDEVEDSLELQAEMLMIRYLAGEEIPPREMGTNNSYAIIPVTEDYAATYPPMSFESKDIWVPQRHETEPARILRMIFRDNENRPMLLEISTPTFDQDELQLAILIWSIVLYAILLSLVLSINWGVIQSSMKPLYAMLRWLDSFDLKYNNQPMHIETNTTEFRRLIDAANRLIARVQELYDQQRSFVDNAAHEMQTPLAVCLNRLEELQQRSDLNEEQLADIDRVRQPLRRLNRLHRDMLHESHAGRFRRYIFAQGNTVFGGGKYGTCRQDESYARRPPLGQPFPQCLAAYADGRGDSREVIGRYGGFLEYGKRRAGYRADIPTLLPFGRDAAIVGTGTFDMRIRLPAIWVSARLFFWRRDAPFYMLLNPVVNRKHPLISEDSG